MKLAFRAKLGVALFGLAAVVLAGVLVYLWANVADIPGKVTRELLRAAAANGAGRIDPEDIELARGADGQAARAARERIRRELETVNSLPPHFGARRTLIPHHEIMNRPDMHDPNKNVMLIVRDAGGRPRVLAAVFPRRADRETATQTDALQGGWSGPAVTERARKPSADRPAHFFAYAPVRNAAGEPIAVLCVPGTTTHIGAVSGYVFRVAAGIFVAALLLALVPVVLISRRLTRPVERLSVGMEQIAEGRLDARIEPAERSDEFGELFRVFNQMAEGLQERERMKASLELASYIQKQLLPEKAPDMEGFDVAGRSITCDESGGDYYDFVDLAHGGLGLALGDVAGHGVGAALLMATARGILRSHARSVQGAADLLAHVNRDLAANTAPELFMTLFCAELQPDSRSLRWASGGHDPALLYRADTGEFDELGNTGVPVGVVQNAEYEEAGPVQLEAGDTLFVGTDGIWEARNAQGELYGKDRLKEVLETHADETAEAIVDAIFRSVAEFRGNAPTTDDITAVVCKAGPARGSDVGETPI
jgi:sigma-B regulation protein RsbU (phosphoserine phosphatase)